MIELLSAMTIMVLLMALAGNIMRTDTRRANVNAAIDDFSGILQTARWEARSKSTFVWVCLKQVTGTAEPGVQVALFASRDGTSDSAGTNLLEVGRRQVLKHVTMPDAATITPDRLGEDYRTASIDTALTQRLGGSTAVIASGQNSYADLILCFNPRGEASIPGATASGFIEVLFAPQTGGPDADAKASSILLSRSTGSAQIYR